MRLSKRFFNAIYDQASWVMGEKTWDHQCWEKVRYMGALTKLDFDTYRTNGSVFFGGFDYKNHDLVYFVVELPCKWCCPMNTVDLYFDRRTGEYVKWEKELQRKLRDDEKYALNELAPGYFNRLREWNFVED